MTTSELMAARINAYEKRMASASATVEVILEETQEELAQILTPNEWSNTLRGIWPEMREGSDLERLYNRVNDYLGLSYEIGSLRSFMIDAQRDEWYLEY